ncbi:MAG: Fpg/Nei family DNA glycosylase [Solirubrobacterales bacterium]
MPEGDTIHRVARRMNAALRDREIDRAEAPSPRSPLHHRAGELRGRTLELAEARGKHLIAHFSGGVALHSHLGMNGRWSVAADGELPRRKPWLLVGSGRALASQAGGQILRLVSESRVRNDPGLLQLGPDPLAPGFDREAAARRLRELGAGRDVGDALLDQRIIAGIGNAIRVEALFWAGISPWRAVNELDSDAAEAVIAANERVMHASLQRGRRPRSIYRGTREPCPRCGGRISSRGQGDANRMAYWCPVCQT